MFTSCAHLDELRPVDEDAGLKAAATNALASRFVEAPRNASKGGAV